MPTKGTAIFLDTSIQIARFIHSPEAKRRIDERIRQFDLKVTSSVVRQEFKRRLLKEAKYVLDLLNRRKSYAEVYHHIVQLPDQWHKRKKNICLRMFEQVFSGSDDAERTERLKLYMHNLLTLGLDCFDGKVDIVSKGVGCACSTNPIRENRSFGSYEFGTDKCSETAGKCGVHEYLVSHADDVTTIREFLKNASDENKSAEIRGSEKFLAEILQDASVAVSRNPCLTVGDLLIALESVGIPTFYTLNGAESLFFCLALRQVLVVRPIDPTKEDAVWNFDDDEQRPTS